ncbi:hypothetical protein BgiBS90_006470 [Biomphalaria glabrata]|nr:hypothetical protein BgiMline_012043 [Biomphalaria glabrata]KAI8793481.1 hypothetical protein BgiBS90_006470 [Biomphalaria glabrata]
MLLPKQFKSQSDWLISKVEEEQHPDERIRIPAGKKKKVESTVEKTLGNFPLEYREFCKKPGERFKKLADTSDGSGGCERQEDILPGQFLCPIETMWSNTQWFKKCF